MFDVKRFRERAADWLGDAGAAALFVAGDVLGAVGKAVRGEPHEEAFERGDESDDELRARIRSAGTSPPASQDPAPHPPGGGQPVDGAAPFRGWMAMTPRRRDLLIRWLLRQRPALDMSPGKADAVHVYALRALRFGYRAQTKPDARLAAYIAWLEAQRPTVDGEKLGPALIGAACDLLRGWTSDGQVPPGPGGDPAPHGGDVGHRVGAAPARCGRADCNGCPACEEWAAWWRIKRDRVDPTLDRRRQATHNATPGALAEARRPRDQAPGGALDAFARWFKADYEAVLSAVSGHVPGVARSAFLAGWTAHGEREPVALADLGLTAAELAKASPPPPPGPWRDLVNAQAANLCAIAAEATRATDGGGVDAALLIAEWKGARSFVKRSVVFEGSATPNGAYAAGQRDTFERCIRDLCRHAGLEVPKLDAAPSPCTAPAMGREERFAHTLRTLCAALPDYRGKEYAPTPREVAFDLVPAVLMMLDASLAGIEEQRLSHDGCTRLPREMLDALGLKDGDLVWFLRSQPGGRWEAWTSAELDRQFGLGNAAATDAAVDRMPHHVASRLTAGEARRLEARGWTAHVAWMSPAEDGAWHESDADDLARLREAAAPEATCSAAEPSPAAERADLEPETPAAAGAAPPVARAAARALGHPLGGAGAPWRGLEHEVQAHRSDLDTWVVEAVDHGSEGEIYAAHFSGQHAEARAREYAAFMSDPAEVSDAGKDPEIVALRERGFTLSPDLEARAAHVLRGVGEAPAEPDESAPPALLKPDAVRERPRLAAGQRWLDFCGVDRVVRPGAIDGALESVDRLGAVMRARTGDEAPPIWVYLGMVKPERVEVGQRWRCVGEALELEVVDARPECVVGLRRLGISGVHVSARAADMLVLKEWSYVGGAR